MTDSLALVQAMLAGMEEVQRMRAQAVDDCGQALRGPVCKVVQ